MRSFCAALLTFSFSACSEDSQPQRYVVPTGYTGRIAVMYGVPGADPMPTQDGHLVATIPRSGVFITSSPFAGDDSPREIVDASGALIPRDGSDYGIQESHTVTFEGFRCMTCFVGTPADLKDRGGPNRDMFTMLTRAFSEQQTGNKHE